MVRTGQGHYNIESKGGFRQFIKTMNNEPPPLPAEDPFHNPYAPPSASVLGSNEPGGQAEAIRREHLNQEASIRTLGFLFLLGAFFLCAASVIGVLSLLGVQGIESTEESLGMCLLFLGLGLFQGWVGLGLRRLSPRVRVPAIVLSIVGLIGFPIGTILSIYFLILLCGSKGKTILSSDYKAIMEETPHIKYRTPVLIWVLLAIVLILLVFGMVAFVFRS